MRWHGWVLSAVAAVWWQTRQASLLPFPWWQALLVVMALYGLGDTLPKLLVRQRAGQHRAQCVTWWSLLLGCWLAASLGFLWAEWRAAWRLAESLPAQVQGVDLVAQGVVAELPRHGPQSSRFRFALDSLHDPRGVLPQTLLDQVPHEVLLSWWQPDVPPRAGERWRLTLRLRPPRGQLNPGGFDYEQYLFEEGIRALGSVRTGVRQRLACAQWHGLGCAPLEQIREHLRDALTRALTSPEGAARHLPTMTALAVGDQSGIASQDWELYRRTGITHLISISGLHITMFAWLVSQALGWLWGSSTALQRPLALRWPRQYAASLGGFAAGWLYALLAGMQTPAARTVIMLGVAMLARHLLRRWRPMDVWHAALAAVVLWDPWAVMQPGFWLSFLGVAILFGADVDHALGWRARLASLLRSQLLVSLAIVPFTALYFQQVSLVAPLANLLAVTPFSLVITPMAVLPLLLPTPLRDWVWQLAHWLLDRLLALLHWLFAQAPVWWSATPDNLSLGLALLGVLLLALRWPWRMRLLGVIFLLPALLTRPAAPAAGELHVWFADVGQGGGVLLRTHSHTLLFDTGPRYAGGGSAGGGSGGSVLDGRDAGARVLVPLMRALGVRALDGLVASHRDSDHTGGLASVLVGYPGTPVWSSMSRDDWRASLTETDRSLMQAGEWRECIPGQHWVWDDVRFTMLWPPPLPAFAPAPSSNARSCVLWVQSRGLRVLLTADLGAAEEAALLRNWSTPRTHAGGSGAASTPTMPAINQAHTLQHVDVLQVGHHGTRYSTSAAWLESIRPRLGVIQSGAFNPFGHPHPDTLARLTAAHVKVLRTDQCGAVWLARADQWQSERHQQARYWRATTGGACSPAATGGSAGDARQPADDTETPDTSGAGDG